MKNEEALDRFLQILGEIRVRVEELHEYFDDHMGFAPDGITWAHVGSASHFLGKLTELTDEAYERGEFANTGKLEN